MFMDFICNDYTNKLGDPCKQQVGMECFFILCPAAGNTETVLKVVDGFFNIYTYFVSVVPFFCPADCSGVSTEILFRINVYHSSTGRSRTRVITVADTFGFLSCFVVFPFHFWADKFHGWKPAAQMGVTAFPFHKQGRIMGTAGNAFPINNIVNTWM